MRDIIPESFNLLFDFILDLRLKNRLNVYSNFTVPGRICPHSRDYSDKVV